jgi:hypothetical protein
MNPYFTSSAEDSEFPEPMIAISANQIAPFVPAARRHSAN